jgi:hypothetical protein
VLAIFAAILTRNGLLFCGAVFFPRLPDTGAGWFGKGYLPAGQVALVLGFRLIPALYPGIFAVRLTGFSAQGISGFT